jgi:O-antigen/teichoic acid export membrane protein
MRSWARLSHLRRDMLLMLAAQSIYRASGIIVMMILARTLPAADIGLLFFAISLAEILTVTGDWSLDPVMFRRISANPDGASESFAALLGLRVLTIPLYFLIFVAVAAAHAPRHWLVLLAIAAFVLLADIYASFGQLFIALHRVTYNLRIGLTTQSLFVFLLLAGMWWAPSLEMVIGIQIVRSLCLIGLALPLAIRLVGRLRLTLDLKFIRQGTPFVFITVLMLLQTNLDTLMLGWLSDYQTVGHYQLACRIVISGFFFPAAVAQIIFRHVAADPQAARRAVWRGTWGILLAGFAGAAVLYLLADPITRLLYGPQAAAASALLKPLSLILPFTFVALLLASVLQARYHEKSVVGILFAATIVEIVIDAILIPSHGAMGAIAARIASASIQAICLGALTWKVYRVDMSPAPIAAPAGAMA